MPRRTIEIRHLTRVEGHGGITVTIDDGQIKDVRMDILEGTRFYEALLRGKPYHAAATIVSRVCAICSASHAICAQMAVEDAFGIAVSERTRRLRDLLLQGENIESHALHLFLLVLPDYLGYPSALDMARDHGEATRMGLTLKRLGNRILELVGGRAVHPPNIMVGRFGKIPGRGDLKALDEEVTRGLEMIPAMMDLLDGIPVPPVIEAPTTYLALRPEDGFGFTSRLIASSEGTSHRAEEFPSVCNERVVSHSHAKQSLYSHRPFVVGAQSRLVLNADRLEGAGRDAYQRITRARGAFGRGNPLHNALAQAVELAFSLDMASRHLRALLDEDFTGPEEEIRVEAREGSGVGLLEAPRGILYHRYEFDASGIITEADIITPTAQNLASIERDMRLAAERCRVMCGPEGLLPGSMEPFAGRDLSFLLQVIARAYDPCISCSVH